MSRSHPYPKDPNWERTEEGITKGYNLVPFEDDDDRAIRSEVEKVKAVKKDCLVLEFGPGDSTDALVAMGCKVTTLEHIDKWYKAAQKRFKDNPSVRVLPFANTMPISVPELVKQRFDIGFVDTPQGWYPAREILPGLEDCSRFNTTIYALQKCKVVLLHDAMRPLERCTLARLNMLGYKFEILKSRIGMARIWKDDDTNAIDIPSVAEPGSPPPRTNPKRRRKGQHKRSDRAAPSQVETA